MKRAEGLDAFEKLAQDLSAPLLRYLRRLLGDPAAADDLLQETLLRMAKGLHTYTGRASIKTWAFSIATNAAADYFRKPERRLRVVDIGEADDVPDTGLPVENRFVVDEMNACVRQVIDSLPEEYRAALVLHDLEGLTVEQTAETCACTMATAKIRIHRARNRLKKALREECNFYRGDDSVLRCDRKR